ncbi:hypothetical protein SAMN05216317_1592 [Nitrosomonas eutropha]|nr:hypothetical protein SAMN05216379_1702 [Nitrosomonas eutropha]SDX18646.1 hypothetical protein SAMN05216317_1592 [Nitrosomonas eutropha]
MGTDRQSVGSVHSGGVCQLLRFMWMCKQVNQKCSGRSRKRCRCRNPTGLRHFSRSRIQRLVWWPGCQRYSCAQRFKKRARKFSIIWAATELAANLFRATQAEEKLKRDQVQGKRQANQTHFEVGKKVRQTIDELGGTMPEVLPTPEQSIKQVESSKKKLEKK